MIYVPPDILKKYPFIRLLGAFVAGILIEWYLQVSLSFIFFTAIDDILFLSIFFLLPVSKRFYFRGFQGIMVLILFMLLGQVLTYMNDIRNQPDWIGNSYRPGDAVVITLQEPLVDKPNSFKAVASFNSVQQNNSWKKASGKILVYFKKDSPVTGLGYGSQLILNKPLQAITNSGNPGAFDYRRYCLFQNITSQVYITTSDFIVLPEKNMRWLGEKLFELRRLTINILRKFIPGNKEQGVAEALLIGYRNDLDKDLVQAYSNTGVVHIIAISGLHLGMIYGLLAGIFSWFKRYRLTKWIKPLVIFLVLWAFTLVAGAVPSIMRAAVMFSFILFANTFNKKGNIYNTLAASAFCMLVYNPFILWDVGFLLSYAAVTSIIIFMKPVHAWLYFQNKMLKKLWSLTAVTISAQVLTIPLIIFYFHQFPNFFLITNFLVVPLSGIVLYGEIFLLCINAISGLAKFTGIIIGGAVNFMNTFIERINMLPFSVWNNLQFNVLQTWLFYGVIISAATWLMRKNKLAFFIAIACLTFFTVSISSDFLEHQPQQKLIVYNIPKQAAVDVIQGRHYIFTGDSIVMSNNFLHNFHLRPCRIKYRCAGNENAFKIPANTFMTVSKTSFIVIDNSFNMPAAKNRIPVDYIIVSKNPKLYMSDLQAAFKCREIIFDSSNPVWKTQRWKKDCDSLNLRFHDVAAQGAFVADL